MRILAEPDLVGMVQALAPHALHQLIEHVGLADSGELISLATTEQLEQLFDADLWRSARPGQDERFDEGRFLLWLEVMLEAGEAFAAQKLSELPEDLVTLALHSHILVIDLDALAVAMSERGRSDDEAWLTEKALDSCLCHEIAGHRIISRRHDGWDTILSVLLALDRDHHEFLQRLLERCCHASTEYLEDNGGLHDVLSSEEMLESDAAADREDRRARQGFIAPSSAASFLSLARATDLRELRKSPERDPISRAYFRGYHDAPEATTARRDHAAAASPTENRARRAEPLIDLLRAAKVLDDARPQHLLEASASSRVATIFERAMVELQQLDPVTHAERVRELGYLANVLIAAGTVAGGACRPLQAAEATLTTCNRGLERWLAHAAADEAATGVLVRVPADLLFRAGFFQLHSGDGTGREETHDPRRADRSRPDRVRAVRPPHRAR